MRIAPEDEAFSAPAQPRSDGRRTGVLLCHGFTGGPSSMRSWAEYLHERGYAVSVPRWPGHCTTWQECNTTTYADWYAEAERAFEKLQTDCDEVYVAGLSMGGCLALNLAVDKGREVSGVVLVNPFVTSTRKDVKLLPVLKHVVPSFPGIASDIKKEGVEERGYRRTPLRALHSLFQGMRVVEQRLPEVTQPLLMFRSRVDHVIDPSSGRTIMTTVSSRDLEERILEDSYHVATLDNDAGVIFTVSAEFIRARTEG
ncbi:alpha/beta hydrolase [Nocardioides caldifontis]|uniref:alpha/beta hydrolase n=1 Tax=Nocardioides caldifontis TaxID=2588938 RepID=UPI001EF09E2B|nr:alpha/beta fold hydrolase [Nocardioides caldifontis]